MINGVKPFMIVSGTWNLKLVESNFLRNFYLWSRYIIQGILLIFIISAFIRLAQLLLFGADTAIIYEAVSSLITIVAVWVKLIIVQNKNVSRIFQRIIESENTILSSSDSLIVKSYQDYIKVGKFINKILVKSAFYLSISFGIFRTVNYLIAVKDKTKPMTEEDFVTESMMYQIWIPFDKNRKADILPVMFIQVVFLVVGVTTYVTSHIISFTLMIFAAAELNIFQVRLRHINVDKENKNDDKYTTIRNIADDHSRLIRFVEEIGSCSKYVMLTNFLLNSLTVAAATLQILTQDNPVGTIVALGIFCHITLTVFLVAWFANEIIVQSLAIGDVIYQTEWYNQDENSKKLLLTMLLRSQRPLTMPIGPFGPMTIETALKTVQAAYSYITLMRNIR